MRVRPHIDRHAVHAGREIGAVVEVEAAQVILVGLARAAVLRDDHAGNGLDDFARPEQRAQRELLVADHALVGGSGDADEAVFPALHQNFGQSRRRVGGRVVCCHRGLLAGR